MIKSLQKKHLKCYLQFCHYIIPLHFLLRFDNIQVKQDKSNPSPPSSIKKQILQIQSHRCTIYRDDNLESAEAMSVSLDHVSSVIVGQDVVFVLFGQ